MKCEKCQDDLPVSGETVVCGLCSLNYHYTCSIRETKWRNMSSDQKSKWACFKCKNSSNLSRANSTTSSLNEEGGEDEGSIKIILSRISTRLDTLDDVKSSVSDLKTSLEFLSGKYDDFLVEVRGYNETTKKLSSEVKELKEYCTEKDKELKALSRRFNALEQYGRGNNLEIHGLDDGREGHNDATMILQRTARALGLPYNPADVQAAHRVPSRNNNNPDPFLIQFVSKAVKEKWLIQGRSRKLKSVDVMGSGDARLYFNDNLTPFYRGLLSETKRVAKKNGYERVWVFKGHIRVKKNQDTRQTFTIVDYDDLQLLVPCALTPAPATPPPVSTK